MPPVVDVARRAAQGVVGGAELERLPKFLLKPPSSRAWAAEKQGQDRTTSRPVQLGDTSPPRHRCPARHINPPLPAALLRSVRPVAPADGRAFNSAPDDCTSWENPGLGARMAASGSWPWRALSDAANGPPMQLVSLSQKLPDKCRMYLSTSIVIMLASVEVPYLSSAP